jgi:hypothetical protein
MDLRCDVDLARACIAAATAGGVRSKAVDYEDFPIDTGTIVANAFVNLTVDSGCRRREQCLPRLRAHGEARRHRREQANTQASVPP